MRLPTPALARRFGKYSMVCVLNVLLGMAILASAFGFLGWSARSANLLGTAIVTLPSYLLNRAWVWNRSGRSHLVREVVPFWALAFIGLGISTWTGGMAERVAAHVTSARSAQTAMVVAAIVATFLVISVARYVVLDSLLFGDRASGVSSEAELANAPV